MVLGFIRLFLEGEVVLDGPPGKLDLFVPARADGRNGEPKSGQDRDRREERKEDGSLEAAADLPCQVEGGKD